MYIPIAKGQESVTALAYIDVERRQIGHPKEEYISRINNAILDGVNAGIPMDYFNKYIRPFIPAGRAIRHGIGSQADPSRLNGPQINFLTL